MIVVVGSLNMDLVVPVQRFPAPGETLLGGDYARHPGGKGANQAVAAARAGGRVSMIGRVGEDAFGTALVGALRHDGVMTDAVVRLQDVPTGVAFISVAADGQNVIVVSPGANARLRPDDLDPDDLADADVVLLQLEVPLDTTLAAASLGRAAGARVILNLAPAQTLEPAALADVDVLLVNETEAAALTERSADEVARAPEAAAAALAERVPAVVLTLGAAGAVWAIAATDGAGSRAGTSGEATRGRVDGHTIEAVDTTAAGDAFAGALAVRLAADVPLGEAVRFANAAGALAATRPGAQPSLPTAAEIEAFLGERTGWRSSR